MRIMHRSEHRESQSHVVERHFNDADPRDEYEEIRRRFTISSITGMAGQKKTHRLAEWSVAALVAFASPAMADWSFDTAGKLHYTDDAALFSATRRLTLNGDPTQPVLDTILTGKGSDMVFEPDLTAKKALTSPWGRTSTRSRKSVCDTTRPPICYWWTMRAN